MISDIINTNWYEVLIVVFRAFFSLIILFSITKLLGKKQVSELSLFDYVISISIGNFAAEISMNVGIQFLNGAIAVTIFGLVATLVSFLTMKSMTLRRFFMGVPTLIIQDGKFVYDNLKKLKLDINDFLETARIAGYFDISDIKYALMEANGKVSFMPKVQNRNLLVKDMNFKLNDEGLCANVIIDGKIIENNLLVIKKNINWLEKELKIKGYNNIDNILLATVDINDKLKIFEKNKDLDVVNVLE